MPHPSPHPIHQTGRVIQLLDVDLFYVSLFLSMLLLFLDEF